MTNKCHDLLIEHKDIQLPFVVEDIINDNQGNEEAMKTLQGNSVKCYESHLVQDSSRHVLLLFVFPE